MSKFGRLLGVTFAVVLVAKVGLVVALYSDSGNPEQSQQIASNH